MGRPKDIVDCLEAISKLKPGDTLPEWFWNWNGSSMEWGSVLSEITGLAAKELRDLRTMQESYSKLCKEVYG